MSDFPIQLHAFRKSIPWGAVAPFDHAAQRLHGQTLRQLAERGGCSPSEVVAMASMDPLAAFVGVEGAAWAAREWWVHKNATQTFDLMLALVEWGEAVHARAA